MKRYFIAGFCLLFLISFSLPTAVWGDDEKKRLKVLEEITGIRESDLPAPGKTPLSLFDVYALAVKKTEQIAVSGEKYLQAETHKNQAFGSMLPRISLKAIKVFPENDTPGYTPNTKTNVSLYARQPIITGLQEWYTFKGSKYEIRMRRYELAHNAGQLLLQVAQYYFSVLQMERTLKNKQEIISLYKKTLGELKRRVRVGRSRETEVLRINTEIYKLEAEIKSLRKELESSRMSLSVLASMPVDSTLTDEEIAGKSVVPKERLKDILKERWDVKAVQEEIKYAETRLRVEQGGHLPSIYLEGYYRLYQKDMSGRDYYGALGAELPLFSGGIVSARVKEARSSLRQAELKYAQTLRTARTEMADAYQRWESTRGELEAYKSALDSAERNYRALMKEYRLNLVTILDVFTALTSLYNAREDYETIRLQNSYNRIRLGVALNEFSGSGVLNLKSTPRKK